MTSYYGRPVVKPPVWKWYVPAYFFTGGVAAGTAIMAAGARVTGDHPLARRCQLSALAATALSGAFLVVDLGRPARFANMLRVAKVTSPMSVGSWVLAAFGSATGLATASEVLGVGRPVGRAAEGAAAALAPAVATYTAVLVADTAVPAWHEAYRELPFVFAGGALASGGALAVLLSGGSPARRAALTGAALELMASSVMKRRLGELAEPYRSGVPGRLAKAAAATTAAGTALLATAGRARRPAAAAGALLVLTGAAAERFAVFSAGVASARDPRYTIEPQRARLGAAAAGN